MGVQGYVVIALALASLLALLTNRATIDAVGIGLIIVLVATRVVSLDQAVAGFSNPALLTIAGLYVIAEGLTATGAVGALAGVAERYAGGAPGRVLLLTGLFATAASAFLNDTAVVLVFIPVVLDMAQKANVPSSRLMMPLAFSALLGGMCTLIGTSTNLLVSGIAARLGQHPLGMFEQTPIGVSIAVASLAFMTLFARRLLPDRHSVAGLLAETEHREYITELLIGLNSPLVGRRYAETLRTDNVRMLFFVRNEEIRWPPYGEETVEAGDVIMLEGRVSDLVTLQGKLDLEFLGDMRIDPRKLRIFEVAISPRSALAGSRVEQLHLQRDYGAVVLAVLRAGHHIHQSIGKFPVRGGDLLLLGGDERTIDRLRTNPDFFVLKSPLRVPLRRTTARRAMVIAAAVVALFVLDSGLHVSFIPTPAAALLGAMAMVAAGCIPARRVYKTIDWRILIFMAGSIALGEAMKHSGAADFVAKGLVGTFSAYGPAVVASGLALLCIVFNTVAPPSAIAAVFTPIAVAAAASLARVEGLVPGSPAAEALTRGFLLAVVYGGSICFHSPLGHQVNLMVFGPGGYRYGDFVRLGLPVSALAWIVVSVGLPIAMGW